MSVPINWKEMTTKERASWLLDQEMITVVDIDPVKIEPAFVPYVAGMRFGKEYFDTEDAAISFMKGVLYSALIETESTEVSNG